MDFDWSSAKDATKPLDERVKNGHKLVKQNQENSNAKKNEMAVQAVPGVDEVALFNDVSEIIERRKYRAQAQVNHESVLMFWEVGKHIGSVLLGGERAAYGKRIVVTLSQQLQEKHGNNFEYTNLTRMIKLAARFPDGEIVVTLSQQLSWSHFIALIPLKTDEAFVYYGRDAAQRNLGVRALRKQISRKTYERQEIANAQLTDASSVPFNSFKAPYLLDLYGLKDNYLEADLKIGRFKPEYSGQMRFYLKWLARYEMLEGENPPIGIILCAGGSRDKIELMELDKEGIAVAEYWTHLPPKVELERKIAQIFEEARERLERHKHKSITTDIKRNIDFFYEIKTEDADIEDEE